jgi:CPA1 family monovalent cation:H+ antiporter
MGWRELLLVSWTGMRGIVTLAVAAEVPALSGPEGFQGRSAIQVIAFMVAVGTLLIQGATLGPLAKRLAIDTTGEAESEAAAMALASALTAALPADAFEERRAVIRAAVFRGDLDDKAAARQLRALDLQEAAANV